MIFYVIVPTATLEAVLAYHDPFGMICSSRVSLARKAEILSNTSPVWFKVGYIDAVSLE